MRLINFMTLIILMGLLNSSRSEAGMFQSKEAENPSGSNRSRTVHVNAQTNFENFSQSHQQSGGILNPDQQELARQRLELQKQKEEFEEQKRQYEQDRLQKEREELALEKKKIEEEKQKLAEAQSLKNEQERERVRREEEERKEKLHSEEERIRQERQELEIQKSAPKGSSGKSIVDTNDENTDNVALPGSSLMTLGSPLREGKSWSLKVLNLSTIRIFDSLSDASFSLDVGKLNRQNPCQNKGEFEKSMKWVRSVLSAQGKRLGLTEKAASTYERLGTTLATVDPRNIRFALSSSTGSKANIDTAYILVTIEGGQVILVKIPGE